MELVRALAVLTEKPGPEHAVIAAALDLAPPDEAAWTDVFAFNLYPYACVYLGPEGMLGGEARDRVAGFVRALDGIPPSDPDGIATLLSAYAQLRQRGDAGEDRAAHAATTLLHEHLLSWLPLYLGRAVTTAAEPYRAWAGLLTDVLRAEAAAHPVDAEVLPAALREAAPFVDPREDDDVALPTQLLVPVRTGFVLTTADLRRAARETRLGLRVGERRYVLEQLLAQSVPTTLRWVADHGVRTTGAALAEWAAVLPTVTAWWQRRAIRTATLLRELADEAEEALLAVVGEAPVRATGVGAE